MESNGSAVTYQLNTLRSGLLVPPFTTQQMVDDLAGLPLRESDVFIATYPKSGTTWMQQIVKLVHFNGQDNNQAIVDSAPWLERVGLKGIKVNFKYAHSDCSIHSHAL